MLSVFTYQGYPPADKFDWCDNPRGSFTSDAININRNYVNGTDTNRRWVAQDVEEYALGMLWYILTVPGISHNTRHTLIQNHVVNGLCQNYTIAL